MAISLLSGTSSPLRGRAVPPGDKSISHRALFLGALAVGETVIDGLLESDDVRSTADALRALGVDISREETESGAPRHRINGVGLGGLREPSEVLHMGNSGTGARLLMGVLATHPVTAVLAGDPSLSERPMARVTEPLRRMGAEIEARDGERLPATVRGAAEPVPITHTLAVASAQVKSTVLFAGLNAPGETSVTEPLPSRDHTERMLRHFDVMVAAEQKEGGAQTITLTGYPEIVAGQISVPGDPSSAAFPAVAALILPSSEITLEDVCVNPLRMGLYETLTEMGGDIAIENQRDSCGEPVADLVVRTPRYGLRGVEVPPRRAPSMIDEYPILAVAAAFAQGTTILRGLAELRVKESDRLWAMAQGLAACGVTVKEEEDALTIEGQGGASMPAGGVTINAGLDHRIAMAFLVFGMAAKEPVTVDGGDIIATSFPGFVEFMNGLGSAIAKTKETS
jgi:3-phosphoshikimate 1-carboxyvinyltransferase